MKFPLSSFNAWLPHSSYWNAIQKFLILTQTELFAKPFANDVLYCNVHHGMANLTIHKPAHNSVGSGRVNDKIIVTE